MEKKSKLYVGMDVHKDTVMVALLPAEAPEPTVVKRLPNEASKIRRWLGRISREGEVRACYEASGAGLRAGTGDAALGLRVRDRGAVVDPAAAGRPAQARPEGRDGAGAAVPGGGVGDDPDPDGT